MSRKSRQLRRQGKADTIVSMPITDLRSVVQLSNGATFAGVPRAGLLVGLAACEARGRTLVHGIKHADGSVDWQLPVVARRTL